MEFLGKIVDLFLHLDAHLTQVTGQYGTWTYALLFLIVFCETGLVVMPILPGDSLLFAAGSLAALGSLQVTWLFPLLFAACLTGDLINYAAGKFLGARLFRNEHSRFFKRAYLERTRRFYETHGAKTIIMARFVPIVRTFAPFVAGMGTMRFRQYIFYCVAGALLWVGVCVGAGYLFGNIPMVKKNFTLVVLAIILLSIAPGILGFIRAKRSASSGRA
ncbi:MAG TPA: DedA family protein [Fibrobacteria bacterium]|nr:DedA family protein [Fibrobacteria bacterium]